MSQASWRQHSDDSACGQQASPACAPGVEASSAEAYSATAGDAQEQWHQQLEVWAIDEMLDATVAQMEQAVAEQHSCDEAAEERSAAQEEECPLEKAGGVCVVRECEWCEEEQWRKGQPSEEEQRGRVQLNKPQWGKGSSRGR